MRKYVNVFVPVLNSYNRALLLAADKHLTQKYDGESYLFHLLGVVQVLEFYGITDEKFRVAGILHDIMEDQKVKYSYLEKLFGSEIAELVFSVTDEIGRTRREKKTKTYKKLAAHYDGITLKLADIIFNMSYGLSQLRLNNKHKLPMYVEESDKFIAEVLDVAQYSGVLREVYEGLVVESKAALNIFSANNR